MSKNTKASQLSAQAFQKLKRIVQDEFGDMPNNEIEEMGIRLLRLFSILKTVTSPKGKGCSDIAVSDQEFKALKYLHHAIYHENKAPSVRDITIAVGFSSSRSGFRLLNKLMERGFVYRDTDGKLQLAEHVKG